MGNRTTVTLDWYRLELIDKIRGEDSLTVAINGVIYAAFENWERVEIGEVRLDAIQR
jgi:hypothetical protein